MLLIAYIISHLILFGFKGINSKQLFTLMTKSRNIHNSLKFHRLLANFEYCCMYRKNARLRDTITMNDATNTPATREFSPDELCLKETFWLVCFALCIRQHVYGGSVYDLFHPNDSVKLLARRVSFIAISFRTFTSCIFSQPVNGRV